MKRNRQLLVVLGLCWVTYVFAYLCRLNLSTVLDKVSVGLDVSMTYLGIAGAVYFGTYALGQLLNGFIGDRVSPHRFIMTALLLTGGINVILGLQSSGTVFLLLWGVNGFCQSMFWSTLLRLLSVYSEEPDKKFVSTTMVTCAVTGYFLSWVVLGYGLRDFSFRAYFLVPGVLALGLIPVWAILAGKLQFGAVMAQRAKTPPVAVFAREFVRDRLYFVAALSLLMGAIQEGAVFWLPTIFATVLGFGEDSLLLLMLVPFAKLIGVFLSGWLLGRFGENVRKAMLTTISAACVVAVALYLLGDNTSLVTVILIAVLITVVNASNCFTISYYPMCFAERNIVSTLIGVLDFSSYMGASAMSGALGLLLERYGWNALTGCWLVLTAMAVLLATTGAGSCLLRKGEARA